MAIHPTALIEPGVSIGRHTSIWDNVHIRHSTDIGSECIIGEKTYVAYGVSIADRVKINAFVYICTGVRIERGVMIAAGTVFTNDRFPRATTSDFAHLLSSDPDENTLPTLVCEGATIGAQCTIAGGIRIGRFAMIGMGSVVTHDVPDFMLAFGHPARPVAYVCACGRPLELDDGERLAVDRRDVSCTQCDARYSVHGTRVEQLAKAVL